MNSYENNRPFFHLRFCAHFFLPKSIVPVPSIYSLSKRQYRSLVNRRRQQLQKEETLRKRRGDVKPPLFLDPNSILLSHSLSDRERTESLLNLDANAKAMYDVLAHGEWLDMPIYISHERMDGIGGEGEGEGEGEKGREGEGEGEGVTSSKGMGDGAEMETKFGNQKRESEGSEEEHNVERDKGREGEGERGDGEEIESEEMENGREGEGKRAEEREGYEAMNRMLIEVGECPLGGVIVLPRDFTLEYFRRYLKDNLRRIRSEREVIRRKGVDISVCMIV